MHQMKSLSFGSLEFHSKEDKWTVQHNKEYADTTEKNVVKHRF